MARIYSFCALMIALLIVAPLEAGSWPDIPESERSLTSVSGFPNAEAVILLRHGRVHFDERSLSSYIEIYTRIKILNEEGTDYGSISVSSSDYMRTKDVEGRTHQPDGRVVEMAEDATFTKKYSDFYGSGVVSCALPEVVPGAIIEYRYRVYFDSYFYPRMWYFQGELPTIKSQVVYELASNLSFAPLVYRTLPNMVIDEKLEENVKGQRVTYTATNLGPVPDEPSRFPFKDLAARVMLLPTMRRNGRLQQPLFDSWEHTFDIAWGSTDWGYKRFRRDTASTRRKGKELAAGKGNTRNKATAIYRWVRDEVQTEPYGSIWTYEKEADQALKAKKADLTEKALLLQAMLEGAKIKSRLGWVNPRHMGRVEPKVPNPSQFFRVIVVLQLDGEEVFLDPTDRSLAFGALAPSLQGVHCLVVDKKNQDWTLTPQLSAEQSVREAQLDLKITEDGGVKGVGSLQLTGNHAWKRILWQDTQEETRDAWFEWIEGRFSGYDVTELEVDEDIEATTVKVSWHLDLREEEVLGDEMSFTVATPLGISSNPFVLTPAKRRTPVLLSFPELNRVRLNLSWPEGWELEEEPRLATVDSKTGSLVTSFEINEEKRSLLLVREFTISKNEIVGNSEYGSFRRLYVKVVAHDAEELVLVAP